MRNEVKALLVVCSVIFGICAGVTAFYVYEGTPFFNMHLVFLAVTLVILTAASLAIAMLSSSE